MCLAAPHENTAQGTPVLRQYQWIFLNSSFMLCPAGHPHVSLPKHQPKRLELVCLNSRSTFFIYNVENEKPEPN